MTIIEKAQLRADLQRIIKNCEDKLSNNRKPNQELVDELNVLKKIYNEFLKSEFQIVLFKIDTSKENPKNIEDLEITYIIYDVEQNNVYEEKKQGLEKDFTPEEVEDYSELFADIGNKYNIWERYPLEEYDYVNLLSNSVVMFKKIIEEVKSKHDCNTWEDLKSALDYEILKRDAYKFHNSKKSPLRINPY